MKTRILPSVLLLLFSAGALEGAIEIVVQPRDQLVRPGAAVTFDVVAQGSGALSYQWQRNGTNLPGATGTSLTFNKVQIDDGAYFSVVVSDGSDTLTSDRAFLLVTPTDPLDTWSIRVPQLATPVFGVSYGADRVVGG